MSQPPSMRSATWQHVDSNPDNKVRYLELLTAQLNDLKRHVTGKLAIAPGQRVLELGCGLGHDTEYMAGLTGPAGHATGVDFSAELIAKATARTAPLGLPLSYRQGDAQALPFADASFDAVRVERTLQHLDDPLLAVREAVRVTRPGGRIVLFEPDWDSVIVSGGDLAISRKLRAFKTDVLTAHGVIGRDAPGLLAQAGCTGITAEGGFFSTQSLTLADTTFGLTDTMKTAIGQGVISAAEGRAWWAGLQEREQAGAFFGLITGSIALGIRP